MVGSDEWSYLDAIEVEEIRLGQIKGHQALLDWDKAGSLLTGLWQQSPAQT